jgi:diacylglycerol kinase family enzyme
MPTTDAGAPSIGRRLLAICSLLLFALLIVVIVVFAVRNLMWLGVALVGLAVAVAGVWWALTEENPRRSIGIATLVLGLIVVVGSLFAAEADAVRPLLGIAIVIAVLAGAAVTGRLAMAPDLHELDRLRGQGHVHPRKPVLLCNPWSGGGKVEKFGLPDIAKELGVEVVLLDHGLDLAQLARDAIAGGADCIGMAGGDGSQALVASIAHEHDIPFVCISAGTRNHFAQDLGFDKEDPRKGMIAFRDGCERFIDYGTVGDRFFVNNVSLGVYATIVQQDCYRDAKTDTAAKLLPEMLGEQAEPFDLQFTGPDGAEIADSFLIMVSNNPYVWGAAADVAQRRTMDSGQLGVMAVNAKTGAEAAAIVTRTTLGVGGTDPRLHEFTCETFEVRSRGGTAFAGIDGEALTLDTPLEFRIHPRALRMLVPEDVLAEAAKRRTRGYSPRGLVSVAMGRRPKALR